MVVDSIVFALPFGAAQLRSGAVSTPENFAQPYGGSSTACTGGDWFAEETADGLIIDGLLLMGGTTESHRKAAGGQCGPRLKE